LYVSGKAKGTSWAKAMSSNEKIKPIALEPFSSYVGLSSNPSRQLVSQSVD